MRLPSPLAVVTVLFNHSLVKSNAVNYVGGNPFAVDALRDIRQGSTDEEVVMALHLLEGCCVVDTSSRSLAARHGVSKVVTRMHHLFPRILCSFHLTHDILFFAGTP